MYRGALRSILSKLAADGALQVVDDIDPGEIKTRALQEKLNGAGVESALILVEEVQPSLYLSSRNIPNVQVLDVEGVDPVSLMRYKNVLATSGALKKLEERLS